MKRWLASDNFVVFTFHYFGWWNSCSSVWWRNGNCADENEKAGIYDVSGLEIVAVDDFNCFLNGSWKFNKDVEAPWENIGFTERFERGKLDLYAFSRRVPDLCSTLHSHAEPWYNIHKNVQPEGCPIKAGVRETFEVIFDLKSYLNNFKSFNFL